MKILTSIILGFILLLTGCGESVQDAMVSTNVEPIVVLTQIAGKTKSEVEAVLGVPSSDETITNNGVHYPKTIYQNGQIEIVFVNGQADWITIYFQELFHEELSSFQKVTYSPLVLSYLGLENQEPTSFSRGSMRWNSIPNILELTVFPNNQGNVRYVYASINTKP